MEPWNEFTLNEVIEVNPSVKLNKGQKYTYVGMKEVDPHKKYIETYRERVYKSGGAKFENGDTLLARITPSLENGKTAFVDILSDGEPGFGSTEFYVLRPKNHKITKQFVYYLSISPRFRRIAIKSMTGTSGRQRVQRDAIEQMNIKIPNIEEQEAITSFLKLIDLKIELNIKMNETLEKMAQTIFKSWFVDFEPFKDGEFVESELGRIPKGWKVVNLKSVGKIFTGKTPPSKEKKYWNGKFPFLTPSDIPNFQTGFGYSISRFLSIEWKRKKPDALLHSKTICVVCIGSTVGKICILKEPSFTNQQINSLTVSNENYSYYMYFYLNQIRKKIINYATGGSTMPIINKGDFSKLKVVLPPESLIYKFQMFVKPVMEKNHLNTYEIDSLTKIRDLLIPQLISGKIRISDPNKFLEEINNVSN